MTGKKGTKYNGEKRTYSVKTKFGISHYANKRNAEQGKKSLEKNGIPAEVVKDKKM